MSADLITLNVHLAPVKKQADEVYQAIKEYREAFNHSPCYLHVSPTDWRAPILEGYCGLIVVADLGNDGPKFRLSA